MAETFYKKLAEAQFFLEKNKDKDINDTPQIILEELFPEKRMEMKLQFLNVTEPNEPDLNLSLGGSHNKPPLFLTQSLPTPEDKTKHHKPASAGPQPPVTLGVETRHLLGLTTTPSSVLPEYYLTLEGFTRQNDKLKIDSSNKRVQDKRKCASTDASLCPLIPPKLPRNGVTIRAMEKGQSSRKQTLEGAISLAAGCGLESIPVMAGKGIVEAGSSSKVNPGATISPSDAMKVMKQSFTATATGDSGNTIEGILYPDKRNPETIERVYHGKSLSPAEFVQHAGCKEEMNPMKHIAVSPSN